MEKCEEGTWKNRRLRYGDNREGDWSHILVFVSIDVKVKITAKRDESVELATERGNCICSITIMPYIFEFLKFFVLF